MCLIIVLGERFFYIKKYEGVERILLIILEQDLWGVLLAFHNLIGVNTLENVIANLNFGGMSWYHNRSTAYRR